MNDGDVLKKGANVNARDKFNNANAILLLLDSHPVGMIMFRNSGLIKLLKTYLELGVEVGQNIFNVNGATAIQIAESRGLTDCVKILQEIVPQWR